ncbi:hypothetical protein [Sulfitobacter pacificus]|uniref:Helix-turn-helix domain-containing protein n=1 Tax=Sulfitobacter pacificus TaxID=1499314 RepID=A0ABQ5VGB3_9RHOB|nr:hypothetical protein [Sulfitobacter pacificus]GLQ26119.1 hypothetical protein GCM10007927_09220 [Sulfitobacter pacificus]
MSEIKREAESCLTGAPVKHQNLEIRGVTYADVSDAAMCLGVSKSAVYFGLRKGCLDRVGLRTTGVAPYPVRIGCTRYESVADAAKALRMPKARIYSAVIAGDPDRLVRPKRYNPWKSIPFTVGSQTWPSMSAASLALGFKNRDYIAKVVKRGSKRGWERILSAAMQAEAQGALIEKPPPEPPP